jgi:hypothetical protein
MANSYLLETPRRTAAITGLQIATLIGSLSRSVELLTVDIEHEEARAGVRDLSDPSYRCWRGACGREGKHQGDHRFDGGVGPRDIRGGLKRSMDRNPASTLEKPPSVRNGTTPAAGHSMPRPEC